VRINWSFNRPHCLRLFGILVPRNLQGIRGCSPAFQTGTLTCSVVVVCFSSCPISPRLSARTGFGISRRKCINYYVRTEILRPRIILHHPPHKTQMSLEAWRSCTPTGMVGHSFVFCSVFFLRRARQVLGGLAKGVQTPKFEWSGKPGFWGAFAFRVLCLVFARDSMFNNFGAFRVLVCFLFPRFVWPSV